MAEFLKNNADFNYNHEAVLIGTQGPDIFFFHHLLNRLKAKSKVGTSLHRAKPAEIIEAFADYCKISNNIDIAKSYMYGFILHYALDRNCHPFVYSLQERITNKNKALHHSSIHNEIESAMDTYMLNKRMSIKNPTDFDGASKLTDDTNVLKEISNVLSFIVPQVTGLNLDENDTIRAVEDSRKFQRLFRDSSGNFKSFCNITETALSPIISNFKISSLIKPKDLEKAKKYGNIKNKVWKSPYDKNHSSQMSFEDLFDYAKFDAQKLIKDFDKLCKGCLNGYEVTNNISFLTGIEVK